MAAILPHSIFSLFGMVCFFFEHLTERNIILFFNCYPFIVTVNITKYTVPGSAAVYLAYLALFVG